ncbi:MAG: phosphocholine cytidylyltransferase family protein [Balneolaceae bacterium]|nr:MAG: phosphocholine cytidylyltransferase family protein [Balneolaceae bacterium]
MTNIESIQIKKAVLLAAGMGARLKPYTNTKPKCLVNVEGNTLLGRLLDTLEMYHYKKVIIVTGYQANQIQSYLQTYPTSLEFEFVHNKNYDTTNNIYSLWLAREKISENFSLIEADLIFDPVTLEKLSTPNRIALSEYIEKIHNGTTAVVSDGGILKDLYINQSPPAVANLYKTVNMYTFCFDTWKKIETEIGKFIEQGHLHIFYEMAIRELVIKGNIALEIADLSGVWWDEIDTPEDLERVSLKLTESGKGNLLDRSQKIK